MSQMEAAVSRFIAGKLRACDGGVGGKGNDLKLARHIPVTSLRMHDPENKWLNGYDPESILRTGSPHGMAQGPI
jgi:hypothetical protein